ncbi:MAG: RNase adapter RapZ [Clostridia bacterium]|nr:RNase adapter RapZ [Clostridia bacterium]
MEFVIVTGISGAGKSRAISSLEDIGFYCVDNIPPALVKNFAELCESNPHLQKVAVVCDSRGGTFFNELEQVLSDFDSRGKKYKILFLDATLEVLVNRFKETRRKHPLINDKDISIEKAIETEIELLKNIREKADYLIDTSRLSTSQLKERLVSIFEKNPTDTINAICMSFGFKYGPATEADLMFDVRCLPNPYYIDELRLKTGLDKEVKEYVLEKDTAKELLRKLIDLIDYLLPLYLKEGKSSIVIAIGCTGGKHRSVTFAEEIHEYLINKGFISTINHRDIEKQ